MAILIKKMELPTNCADCPMFEYATLSNCKLLKKPLMWYESHEGRDKGCPLSEAEILGECGTCQYFRGSPSDVVGTCEYWPGFVGIKAYCSKYKEDA